MTKPSYDFALKLLEAERKKTKHYRLLLIRYEAAMGRIQTALKLLSRERSGNS